MSWLHPKFLEIQSRSLVQVFTWRVLVTITNFFGGLITSGDWRIGLGVASFALVVNSILYWLHERFWNHMEWGRKIASYPT